MTPQSAGSAMHATGRLPVSLRLRHWARTRLLGLNYWSERIVEPASIHRLLARLHPLTSPIPLRRIGAAADGGYLVPDDLEGIGALISPGVNYECSFDKHLADMGIDVHMADASVPGPPEPHERFTFSPLFLDTYTSERTVTLDDFCRDIKPGQDLILQMDIEGAEYRVLAATSDDLMRRFRIIVLEVHWLNALFTPFGLQQIDAFFDRLLRTHSIVHIHPNNAVRPVERGDLVIPPVVEMTLLRNDRAVFEDQPITLPHPLDAPNVDYWPDYTLPDCFYRKADR